MIPKKVSKEILDIAKGVFFAKGVFLKI